MTPIRCLLIVALLGTIFPIASRAETLTPDELQLVKQAEEARIRAIESVYGSVVAIYGQSIQKGGGSGVLFDSAGYALTNHHVVAAAGQGGKAGLADGKIYNWKLIGTDPGGDVAIIKLSGKDEFPVSPLGRSDRVRVGDWAMAMGNPFVLAEDQTPTVTLGIVSGVERYQYGAGRNTLVYGNCIQVDSSINPGNSGGPLYNMYGQVIGINGRGSFKERGRVNVGVGYAISMKQIRNFIPELMATKLSQHGTLDALFSNRADGVICDTINLDCDAAKAGLQLGDRLVSFEGVSIFDANQFTNLISTLPAAWPIELTYEREGKQNTIWVRLAALPYGGQQEPPEEDDGKPKIKVRRPGLKLGEPGAIGDENQNQENAQHVLSRWKLFTGVAALEEKVQALKLTDELLRKDKKIGEVTTLLARDGRFQVEYNEYGVKYAYGFDGETYWAVLPDREPFKMEAAELVEQPLAAQALAMSAIFRSDALQDVGKIMLDGSDKARRRPCYRLRLGDGEEAAMYAWLQMFDDDGKWQVQLAKTGPDTDGRQAAVVYSNWQPTAGVLLPHTRELASTLAEESVVKLATSKCVALSELDEDSLRSPVNAAEK